MTFADKIKELCKQKGVSVHKMERDLGFGSGYTWTLKDKIPTDRAIKIADYFGLPSDYFMPETIKKGPALQNPTIDELVILARDLSLAEQEELLSFAKYIQSKR